MPKCNVKHLLGPTSSGKLASFSKPQLLAMRELIDSYGDKSPRWLMSETKLTLPRRRLLLNYFYESGLDSSWCGYAVPYEDWSTHLHIAYHTVEACK